jgi:predicted negative regulator of RcsB-dependent stress response
LGPLLSRIGAALRGFAAVTILIFAAVQPIGFGASAASGAVERAVALQAAGRPALALEALAAVPPGDPRAARGVVEGLRGNALLALARHGEAEAAFAASIERARARGDLATALRSRINLAIVLNETGRAARASIALKAAHRAASAAGHGDAALLAATNAVEFEAADTARWLQRALDAEERAPVDARTAAVRVRLARLLVDRGAADPARIGAILARAEEAGRL